MVMQGMWFGLLFFGYLADRSGRRIVYISSLSCVFVFGLLSAFSPSFWTLVVTRLLVGFGVGGSGVAFAMFSEFLPAAKRGEYLVYIEVFWTVGTLIGAGIAWGTLTQLSWRWMVGLAALPALPPLFFARWLPESPRHLAISGRQQDALDQLRAAAIQNGTKLPADLRLEVHVENKRGNMKQLFTPDRRRLTFVLLLLAFVNCFAYYGLVIVTPSFFASLHNGDASESSMYLEVFIVSAAEFPGILASAYLINRVGRKLTQVILLGITGVATLMLIIDMPSWGTTIFAMLTRAAILGAYSTLLVFTVEAYPTHLRATAYGLCGAFSRIAGITTPFVAAIAGADDSYTIPLIVYGVTAMVAAALAYILPIETGGMGTEIIAWLSFCGSLLMIFLF